MSAKQTPDSFWSRVTKGNDNECWEWQGACNSGGYGTAAWGGKVVPAHRLAYFLHAGGIALATKFREEGRAKRYRRFVLHRCDNRKCCNPAHLFLGSLSANMKDAYKKGRKKQPTGSAHSNAKLTTEQVTDIRRRYDAGELQVPLAAEYNVSQRAISLIVRRETYK